MPRRPATPTNLSARRWIPIKEAAVFMGLSRWTLLGMIDDGQLPAAFVLRIRRKRSSDNVRIRKEWMECPSMAAQLLEQFQRAAATLLFPPFPPGTPLWTSLRKAARIWGISYECARSKIRRGLIPPELYCKLPKYYMVRTELVYWPNLVEQLAQAAREQQQNLGQ